MCTVIFDAVTRDSAAGRDDPTSSLDPWDGPGGLGAGRAPSQTGNPRQDDPIGYELGLHNTSVLSLRGAPTTWETSFVSKKLVEDAGRSCAIGDVFRIARTEVQLFAVPAPYDS